MYGEKADLSPGEGMSCVAVAMLSPVRLGYDGVAVPLFGCGEAMPQVCYAVRWPL